MSSTVARPTGTVTFLFTDIEGSSRQWESDVSATEILVAAHDKLVRTVVEGHDGYVFSTTGDGFAVAFQRASEAVSAAVEVQETLAGDERASSGLRVRMGVHTGEAVERDGDYFGPTVNRAARIMGLAHGGQILVSSLTAGLVESVETVDLGEHRLRGLSRPERLYQVVAAGLPREFPPLHGDQASAHNLPAALTSFVGREDDLIMLSRRLAEERLVTLVGAGGVGKTRLAVETARRVFEEFDDGVWLVELAALRDPDQVASTVARAVGYHDPLAEAGGPALVRERLAAAVADQRMLLLLDNCEHLVQAAADLAAGLVRSCPRLVVLATSRQSLGVAGERLVEVGSLNLPGDDNPSVVAESGAGSLFVVRAQAIHPGFRLDDTTGPGVAEVCRRLDGVPLAIELAAARVRVLTPAQIASRLDQAIGDAAPARDLADRHHTMRAALAWSVDLLTEAERSLFRRLAVFRASFVLEAVEAVSGDLGHDTVELLGSLVDKSLVLATDGPAGERRFRLLEPVRQFAMELLNASGELDDARRRHRDHLLARVAAAQMPSENLPLFPSLLAELDNVRAAIDYSLRASEPASAAELARSYRLCWRHLGLSAEMLDVLTAALSALDVEKMSPISLANLLGQVVADATYQGRFEEAARRLDQLDALHRRDPSDAIIRWRWSFGHATYQYWGPPANQLEGDRLMAVAQQAQDETGLPEAVAQPVCNILLTAILYDTAARPDLSRIAHDGIVRTHRFGAVPIELGIQALVSVIAVINGDDGAYSRCVESLTSLDQLGGGWTAEFINLYVGIAAELVGDHQFAGASTLRAMEYFGRSGLRFVLAYATHGAARFAARVVRPENALRLWGAAEHLETTTGLHQMPLMIRLDTRLQQACRDAVGTPADALLAEGEVLSGRDLIETAQQTLLAAQQSNWPDPAI
jgi:predicted ATPase/class 3 adenylate cyclase